MKTYFIEPTLKNQFDGVFRYHEPQDDQIERYLAIRDKARELAYLIGNHTPPSREQSLALTHLQECVMFANAAIAVNESTDE